MQYVSLLIIGVLTYALAVVFGPVVINYLIKLSFKQVVREEGLESHHKKTGTPTMGGFIFLIPSIAITILWAILTGNLSIEMIMILFSTVFFGLIGFVDDYLKVVKKHNEGLTAKQKLVAQLLAGVPLAVVATLINSGMWIPFTSVYIDLGWFYGVFVLVIILAVTNAVNLTDGVDGLSSSVTVIVLMFFAFVAVSFNMVSFSMFSVSLIGGLFGFLLFNKNPARVFMGDIGSLALGGAVVGLAIFTNTVLLIPIVGVIYFVEALSVTIQVLYFKKTKKRVFRMTPIHHHFELGGWNEKKIVRNFSFVSLIGVVIGVISILPIL